MQSTPTAEERKPRRYLYRTRASAEISDVQHSYNHPVIDNRLPPRVVCLLTRGALQYLLSRAACRLLLSKRFKQFLHFLVFTAGQENGFWHAAECHIQLLQDDDKCTSDTTKPVEIAGKILRLSPVSSKWAPNLEDD